MVPAERRADVLGNLRNAIMETHGGHIHTGHRGTTSVIEALAIEVAIPVNSRATICIPKMCRHPATVRENGDVLFRNGVIAGTVTGVLDASETTEQVELRVGSGSYSFLFTGW